MDVHLMLKRFMDQPIAIIVLELVAVGFVAALFVNAWRLLS